MLKATIGDLAFFENFLGIINKFVQQCQFILRKDGVSVYCKNAINFSSARLLLDSDIIKLNEDEKVDEIKICIRDIIAFKSAISIVQQVEEVESIELQLEDVKNSNQELFIKTIKYNSKVGGSFNLITIDFDVIKDFVSKNSTSTFEKNWEFNIDPKNLDIVQNRTGNIINFDEVSVYIYPKCKNGAAMVELSSKKSAAINSITLPISSESIGSLDNFGYDEIAVHESSFRIFNILKVTDKKDLNCFFNFDNNIFFITSKLNDKSGHMIKSRLFVQMVKGK